MNIVQLLIPDIKELIRNREFEGIKLLSKDYTRLNSGSN